jgi:hypothetical protein
MKTLEDFSMVRRLEANLVGWHCQIIGTPSHLSKSCLLISFLG